MINSKFPMNLFTHIFCTCDGLIERPKMSRLFLSIETDFNNISLKGIRPGDISISRITREARPFIGVVFAISNQPKVFNAVVKSVAINMVEHLLRGQRQPMMGFVDSSMEKYPRSFVHFKKGEPNISFRMKFQRRPFDKIRILVVNLCKNLSFFIHKNSHEALSSKVFRGLQA